MRRVGVLMTFIYTFGNFIFAEDPCYESDLLMGFRSCFDLRSKALSKDEFPWSRKLH